MRGAGGTGAVGGSGSVASTPGLQEEPAANELDTPVQCVRFTVQYRAKR